MNNIKKRVFRMDDKDNVGTSLDTINSGEMFDVITKEGETIETNKAITIIPFGYKVALKNIPNKDSIIKYGYKIGSSFKDIKKGEVVHIHNIKSNRVGLPENRRKAMIDMLQKDGYQIN
jgi:altronate dehydratase small subunit